MRRISLVLPGYPHGFKAKAILKLGEIQLIFFIVCFLIVLKHKPNIERLLKGKESKIKLKKKN